jgi:hypothetical protein
MARFLRSPSFAFLALLLLTVAYLALRVAWYDRYPPARNYDHFNTETTLNVLRDPSLYPSDPIWSGGGQADTLGFLFVGFLRLTEALFGEFTAAWTFLYALHLLIFLPGAFLCFRFLTREWWLAALMALISSLPFYLYFSYTNWGISSPYARTFVTVQIPWLFWGLFVWLDRRARGVGAPLLLAFAFSTILFWNPVYGLGLIQMAAFVLLVEWWAGRIHWREWGLFVGVTGAAFLFYYISAGQGLNSSDATPLTDAEVNQVIKIWTDFAGLHFFPWAVTEQQAFWVVTAISLSGAILLLSAPFSCLEQSQAWWGIGLAILLCQAPGPMIMTRDFSFLLMVGYWLYRYRRLDRWDVLLLSALTATNLASLAQSALGFYLFSQQHILAMASIAFEGYRPIRWDFWLLFLFAGRWCADLLAVYRQDRTQWPALLAIPFILGSLLSRIGHVGHDDGMIVRPMEQETLRQWLPFLALAWAILQRMVRAVGAHHIAPLQMISGLGFLIPSSYAAYLFASNLPDFYETIPISYGVGAILLLGLFLWGYEQRARLWHGGLVLFFLVALVVWPISHYYRAKADYNPSADFNVAADWAQANTPNEALFLPLGLDPMPFRAQSERSVLAWDLLQTYYFVGPRAMLQSEAYFDPILALDSSQPELVRQTLEAYPMDYIVAANSAGLWPYPIISYSPTVSIYYPVNKATRDLFYDLPNGGLSDLNAQALSEHQSTFELLPCEATLLMPLSPNGIQRTEALQALAQVVEIATQHGQHDHSQVFDLMLLFNQMRYPHELTLTPDQQQALDQWNASKLAQDLAPTGIRYLLIDSRWWDQLGDDQRAQLQDPQQYRLLGQWEGLISPWLRLYILS